MARAAYRKSDNGERKRRSRSEADEDGDEEYVLDEDEVEESESDYESDINSRDLSDEGSFQFSESDEDEKKEFKIERSKKTKTKTKSNRRDRKASKVSDDEMYDLNLSVPKKGGRGGLKKRKSMDSDYESDEGDEDDEDFLPEEDDSDEDEVLIVSKRKGGAKKRRSKVSKAKGRKRQKRTMTDSDDDFLVNDKISVARKRSDGKKTVGKRRNSVDSEPLDLEFVTSDDDFVVSNRRKRVKKEKKTLKGRRKKRAAEDLGLSDSDFVVSDEGDDSDVKDQFVLERPQKNGKKVKKTARSKQKGKKGSVGGSDSSDSDFVISCDDDSAGDDDFDVKDQIVVYKQQMNKKKEKGNKEGKRRRNRSLVVSASSDSDYLISEEEDEFVMDEQPKKSKKSRENRAAPKIERRRLSSSVDYGSESFDFDDVVSEEEVRDLGIGGGLRLAQPKRLIARKKGEDKGKAKQAEESGLQVCGVCLSEEKKSVVQGLLNCCFHYFCFACIMEWSKVESRCPVCKRRFETITKSGGSDPSFGMRNSVIRVQKRDQVYQPSEDELRGMLDPYENVVCMECQHGGDDNLMLLCDICDSSAHTYCVGLGREVPEGNWYCECCRSVNDGLYHSQFQDTAPQQAARNGDLFPAVIEGGRSNNLRVNLNSPRTGSMSGRPSSLRIDLNSSPRDFLGDDHFVSSPISGSVASTVSGRRHIRQRIHVILSTNRQRAFTQMNMLNTTPTSDVSLNEEALRVSENQSPLFSNLSTVQHQQNPRPSFRSHANLAPCISSEGSSLRHVDGAKKEVEHMVKSHLKSMPQNMALERSKFKEIVRTSTYAILAACGIEHHRNRASATAVDPPDDCPHYSDDGPSHLLKGCCLSCFDSFVKDVVHRLLLAETS